MCASCARAMCARCVGVCGIIGLISMDDGVTVEADAAWHRRWSRRGGRVGVGSGAWQEVEADVCERPILGDRGDAVAWRRRDVSEQSAPIGADVSGTGGRVAGANGACDEAVVKGRVGVAGGRPSDVCDGQKAGPDSAVGAMLRRDGDLLPCHVGMPET